MPLNLPPLPAVPVAPGSSPIAQMIQSALGGYLEATSPEYQAKLQEAKVQQALNQARLQNLPTELAMQKLEPLLKVVGVLGQLGPNFPLGDTTVQTALQGLLGKMRDIPGLADFISSGGLTSPPTGAPTAGAPMAPAAAPPPPAFPSAAETPSDQAPPTIPDQGTPPSGQVAPAVPTGQAPPTDVRAIAARTGLPTDFIQWAADKGVNPLQITRATLPEYLRMYQEDKAAEHQATQEQLAERNQLRQEKTAMLVRISRAGVTPDEVRASIKAFNEGVAGTDLGKLGQNLLISDAEAEGLVKQANQGYVKQYITEMRPQVEKLRAQIESDITKLAPTQGGIAKLRSDVDAYNAALKELSTVNLDGKDVHVPLGAPMNFSQQVGAMYGNQVAVQWARLAQQDRFHKDQLAHWKDQIQVAESAAAARWAAIGLGQNRLRLEQQNQQIKLQELSDKQSGRDYWQAQVQGAKTEVDAAQAHVVALQKKYLAAPRQAPGQGIKVAPKPLTGPQIGAPGGSLAGTVTIVDPTAPWGKEYADAQAALEAARMRFNMRQVRLDQAQHSPAKYYNLPNTSQGSGPQRPAITPVGVPATVGDDTP